MGTSPMRSALLGGIGYAMHATCKIYLYTLYMSRCDTFSSKMVDSSLSDALHRQRQLDGSVHHSTAATGGNLANDDMHL